MRNFYKLLTLMACGLFLLSGLPTMAQKTSILKFQSGNGIPARVKPVVYTQPDGSTITLKLKGDRVIHWAENTDGYTLLCGTDKYYVYAIKDINGNLVSSNVTAHNEGQRSAAENVFLSSISKGLEFSNSQIKAKLENYRFKTKSSKSGFPPSGNPNFLVILMQFPDRAFTNAQADIDSMMNEVGYNGIGSFNDYHYENSFGKLDVATTVVGPYTAAHNAVYYGSNTPSDDANVGELITEAVNAANADVDYNDFDNDSDGEVDAVYIIYAGEGEANSGNPDDIWPHASTITTVTLDGVDVSKYACSNELINGDLGGIGTICHEFGHSIGLPDYYDTDYGTSGQGEGTGSWDVMAGGNSNGGDKVPANHNPYSKKMLNWFKPVEITSTQTITMTNAAEDSVAYYIKSAVNGEYFLFENRQFVSFDDSIPGHGMLIYHVDDNYIQAHLASNDLNADSLHQGFDIEEADGDIDPTTQSDDTYPGTTSTTSFTDATLPGSLAWNSSPTSKPITNIAENGNPGVITFDIAVSGIAETSLEKLSIFPSITDGKVYIISEGGINLKVFNTTGQRIREKNDLSQMFNVDLSEQPAGIYFFEIEKSGKSKTFKIVRK
ncbi:MAG: M6 family metalloprotease domain-containing protein [Bacteroidota bacterium]